MGDRKFAKSSDDWRILPELDVGSGDHLVIKRSYSAFFDTELHDLLQRLLVTGLVVGGVNTYACVRCTTIDAYQHDYDPIFWAADYLTPSLPQFERSTIQSMVKDSPEQGGIVEGMLSNANIAELLDN